MSERWRASGLCAARPLGLCNHAWAASSSGLTVAAEWSRTSLPTTVASHSAAASTT